MVHVRWGLGNFSCKQTEAEGVEEGRREGTGPCTVPVNGHPHQGRKGILAGHAPVCNDLSNKLTSQSACIICLRQSNGGQLRLGQLEMLDESGRDEREAVHAASTYSALRQQRSERVCLR